MLCCCSITGHPTICAPQPDTHVAPILLKSRKRGRRGGVRRRCQRRGKRLPLPSIVLANVRSLQNKIDEIRACNSYCNAYKNCSMMCFTETWLHQDIEDYLIEIDSYLCIRSDRTLNSGKTRGGGICLFIKEAWCKNISVRNRHCDPNIELLVVLLRPFYLPREIPCLHVVSVYIPPDGNYQSATATLTDAISTIENSHPDSVNFVLGDFNQCEVKKHLPRYHQMVSCTTRGGNTLDLCYVNVKGSHKAVKLPPIGDSDHNSIALLPKYRQKYKVIDTATRTVKVWTDEAVMDLKACLELTDWDVLNDPDLPLDRCVDTVSSYITFCTDMLIPTKEIKCYSNNKPWIKKDLKALLNRKKTILATNDNEALKAVNKEVRAEVRKSKEHHRAKVEDLLKSNRSRDAWQGLNLLSGRKQKPGSIQPENDTVFATELNDFYARFDSRDETTEMSKITKSIREKLPSHSPIQVTTEEVERSFRKQKQRKAAGPDGISGRVVRMCSSQLAPVFKELFNRSLRLGVVPHGWKFSTIIPVPKDQLPKVKNDLRPVALTDLVFKNLERLVCKPLKAETAPHNDPNQFAYSDRLGVEDASLTLLHHVYSHLDREHAAIRIVFIDFSSAFNTISPALLAKKLIEMGVNPYTILWICSFLTERTQQVKFNGTKSPIITTNIGAPQGCVLSPVLFTLYTADCRSTDSRCIHLKYADDTALVNLVNKKRDNTFVSQQLDRFTEWCTTNHLTLNVKKTKELVIGFGRTSYNHEPLVINSENIERVSEYKYLGTIIDDKLTWTQNIDRIHKKCSKRLYFVRQLGKLSINNSILRLFYESTTLSVLAFNAVGWYGNASDTQKKKLQRIEHNTNKIIKDKGGRTINDIYERRLKDMATRIQRNPKHPLHSHYSVLPSGRRYASIYANTNRYKYSFVPTSIRRLNGKRD